MKILNYPARMVKVVFSEEAGPSTLGSFKAQGNNKKKAQKALSENIGEAQQANEKKRKGVTFANKVQVKTFKRGNIQNTDRIKSPQTENDKCSIWNELPGMDSDFSLSSPASKEADYEESENLSLFEDNDVGIPEGYHQCFEEDSDLKRVMQSQETEQLNPPTSDIILSTFGEKKITDVEGCEAPNIDESVEDTPKALTIIQPSRDEGKPDRQESIEGFSISKEIVLNLRKNNLCIRPIVGSSSKKGSLSQKRKNREMTNLLRSWEKEVESIEELGNEEEDGLELVERLT